MTRPPARPLASLRLRPRDHRAALAWLFFLYCDSWGFRNHLAAVAGRGRQIKAALILYLHTLPWLVLIAAAGRLVLTVWFGQDSILSLEETFASLSFWLREAFRVAVGLTLGLAGGLVVGLVFGLVRGLVLALGGGMAIGLAGVLARRLAGELAEWLAVGLGLGLAVGLTGRLAGGWSLGLVKGFTRSRVIKWAVALVSGLASVLAVGQIRGLFATLTNNIVMGVGIFISVYRVYYLPYHLFLVWPRPRAVWYPRHPVAWDKMCGPVFPGLGRLLVAYAELDPARGEVEIERLLDDYPTQRKEALWAKTVLTVRAVARETDLSRLPELAARLPQGAKGYLAQTEGLAARLGPLARQARILRERTRPLWRLAAAEELGRAIEDFRAQVSGLAEPLAGELRAAAQAWLEIARADVERAQAHVHKEGLPALFRAGGEVDLERDAFVKREGVLQELEAALAEGGGRTSLLLYGRRRMGKSSVIRNLPPFLPESVGLISVSMLDVRLSQSQESFAAALAGELAKALPGLEAGPAEALGLLRLQTLLDQADGQLQAQGRRLLIVVDEYEHLDNQFKAGAFAAPEVLGFLRLSLERHRAIAWLLVGSRHVQELPHAPWSSYLISLRTIQIPFFSPDETHLLLTQPLRHARTQRDLPYQESTWGGPAGIARIHRDTGGWPYFVQLLAESLRSEINADPQAMGVDEAIYRRATARAVQEGQNAFIEIILREGSPGEWDYLRDFGCQVDQPEPADPQVLAGLLRREMVWRRDGRCGLTVPLMGEWLARQP